MKTPRFWYPRTNDVAASLLAVLLSPLSLFFIAGAVLRRFFARPYRSRVPLICVGNAVAGGTGKTPTALALAQMFRDLGHKPVFVTRGYGGRGKVTYVDPARHIADEVGDEALLLAAFAPTWAGRNRIAAVRQAESHGTVIIMDDGLQNPHIRPTASLLVVDGERGVGNGHVIPAGPLRESFMAAIERCALVVVIGEEDRQKIALRAARAKIPALRAHLRPRLPNGFPREGRFVAFAGIARPEKFYATARTLGLDIADTMDFADHHPFDQADIDMLRLRAEEQGAHLLTTEKDAARLPAIFLAEVVILPVELVFEDENAAAKLTGLVRDLL